MINVGICKDKGFDHLKEQEIFCSKCTNGSFVKMMETKSRIGTVKTDKKDGEYGSKTPEILRENTRNFNRAIYRACVVSYKPHLGELNMNRSHKLKRINNNEKNENLNDVIFVLLLFIVSFLLYFWYAYYVCRLKYCWNADYLYYVRCGKDIMSGNILLKDWYGTTNSFYLISLIYGMVGNIVGFTPILFAVTSALLIALGVVLLSTYIIIRSSTGSLITYIKAVFFSSWFLFSVSNNTTSIFGGSHYDVMIVSTLVLLVVAVNNRNWSHLDIIVYVLLFIEFCSDDLSILYVFVSIILFIVSYLFFPCEYDGDYCITIWRTLFQTIPLLILYVISIVVTKMPYTISVNSGVNPSIISGEDIFKRAGIYIQTVYSLFNGDVFSKEISIKNILVVFGSILFTLYTVCLFLDIKEIINDRVNRILFQQIIVSALIIVFVDYGRIDAAPYQNASLCFPALISALMIFSSIDVGSLIRINVSKRMLSFGYLAIAGVLIINTIINTPLYSRYENENKYRQIARMIADEGFVYGLSTYWQKNPVEIEGTYEKIDVKMNQVVRSNDGIGFLNWGNKPNKDRMANYIVFSQEGPYGLLESEVTNVFGIPYKRIIVEDIVVYFYSYNLIDSIVIT